MPIRIQKPAQRNPVQHASPFRIACSIGREMPETKGFPSRHLWRTNFSSKNPFSPAAFRRGACPAPGGGEKRPTPATTPRFMGFPFFFGTASTESLAGKHFHGERPEKIKQELVKAQPSLCLRKVSTHPPPRDAARTVSACRRVSQASSVKAFRRFSKRIRKHSRSSSDAWPGT